MNKYVLANYLVPSAIKQNECCVQTFLSDPTKLELTDPATAVDRANRIAAALKTKNTSILILHGSYLIGNLGKGYQKALLKQELHQAHTINQHIDVIAYVLHLHNGEMLNSIPSHPLLAFENTSHVITNKEKYIQLLSDRRLVIDISHIYCSGLARTPTDILNLLKRIDRSAHIAAIHLNDQTGEFASGKDLHAPIGQGHVFERSPEALELLIHIIDKYTVVLEYSGTRHVEAINCYRLGNMKASRLQLAYCAGLCAELAELSSNVYQEEAYLAYENAFAEISDKQAIEDTEWQRYQLGKKASELLLYTVLTTDEQVHEPVYREGIKRKKALSLLRRVLTVMGLKEGVNAFVAGSIRRGCSTIGDIDIVWLTESPEETETALERLKAQNIRYSGSKFYRLAYGGSDVDVHTCTAEELPYALLYLTGSKAFNVRMRKHAQTKGFKLSNVDMRKLKNDKPVRVRSERDIFKILGLEYVDPVYRVI